MPNFDEKTQKMVDEALAKSKAKVEISEDGTVSGPPEEYFKFLWELRPDGNTTKTYSFAGRSVRGTTLPKEHWPTEDEA